MITVNKLIEILSELSEEDRKRYVSVSVGAEYRDLKVIHYFEENVQLSDELLDLDRWDVIYDNWYEEE
jgi:hypothetical protein